MTVRTKRLALAAWWLMHGLVFVETSRLEEADRCSFFFNDPEGRERELTAAFFQADEIQHYLTARHALTRSLLVAKRAPTRRCTALPNSGHGATR